MKTNIFQLLIVLLSLSMVSCEDDFLHRPPLDQVSSDAYWTKANDLKLYVNQYYTMFSDGGTWSGGIYWFDTNSDNMVGNSPNDRLAGRTTIPTDEGFGYGNIRGLNFFMENYKKCTDPFDQYKQFLGEAYFFRAKEYYDKVKKYGDIQWISKTLEPDSEDLYGERNPRDQVIDSIIADLDKAIEYMSSGPNEGGTRLNKEIAMLIKARVCLYEGTWEKYHQGDPFGVEKPDYEKYLRLAEETSNALINSGVYSIYTTGDPMWDYYHLFNQVNYSGNPEVMLWKKYDQTLGLTNNHQRYLAVSGGGVGITRELVRSYLCTDGKPISVSSLYLGDDSLTLEVTNRDLRLRQTVYTRGFPKRVESTGDTTLRFVRADIDLVGESRCPTGYQLCKGANPDPAHYDVADVGTVATPLYRYAEALLIYAEAKAELGELTQEDVDKTINILRDRVGMAHLLIDNIENDPNWDFPDLNPVINEVRRERRIEFACEGYRFDDLMRWGAADELITGKRFKGAKFNSTDYSDLNPADYVMDENGYLDPMKELLPTGFYEFKLDRDYLSPISINELTLNPNLEQNPGWD